eukprot:1198670-Rhodomonas_salina.5
MNVAKSRESPARVIAAYVPMSADESSEKETTPRDTMEGSGLVHLACIPKPVSGKKLERGNLASCGDSQSDARLQRCVAAEISRKRCQLDRKLLSVDEDCQSVGGNQLADMVDLSQTLPTQRSALRRFPILILQSDLVVLVSRTEKLNIPLGLRPRQTGPHVHKKNVVHPQFHSFVCLLYPNKECVFLWVVRPDKAGPANAEAVSVGKQRRRDARMNAVAARRA